MKKNLDPNELVVDHVLVAYPQKLWIHMVLSHWAILMFGMRWTAPEGQLFSNDYIFSFLLVCGFLVVYFFWLGFSRMISTFDSSPFFVMPKFDMEKLLGKINSKIDSIDEEKD